MQQDSQKAADDEIFSRKQSKTKQNRLTSMGDFIF